MSDLVLLDIDGTLFNPEYFGKLIRAEFVKVLRIDEEGLMRTIADYYANLELTSDFNPRDITVFIAQRHNADSSFLDKVFWDNNDIYNKSIYPEVKDVLGKLSADKTLGIFSQGNDELQRHKLEACGIDKFFSKDFFYIYRRKGSEESIAELPREATVVDDNHDLVLTIKPYVEAIWMNRRTEDNDPNIRTIHNLKELL